MRGCWRWAAGAVVLMTAGSVRAAPALKVDAPASGCPRRKDLVAALEARVPGLTRTGAGAGTMRRLALETTDTPGVVQLRLFDDRDVLALERRLGSDASVGGARPRADQGCQALAEAVALVVDRYLREIGYRPPAASVPAPPAPPEPAGVGEPPAAAPVPATAPAPEAAAPVSAPAAVAAASVPAASAPVAPSAAAMASPSPAIVVKQPASDRPRSGIAATTGGDSAIGIGIGGGARLGPSGAPGDSSSSPTGSRGELLVHLAGHRGHLLGELGVGAATEIAVPITAAPGAELRLRAFPLRVGVGGWWAAPGGALVASAGLSADLVAFRAVGLDDPRSGLRVDPAAELGGGYVVQLGALDVRAHLGGGLTLAPRDFQVGGSDPVYRTPAVYFRSHIQVGWTLWKN